MNTDPDAAIRRRRAAAEAVVADTGDHPEAATDSASTATVTFGPEIAVTLPNDWWSEATIEHLRFLMEALALYVERRGERDEVWRRSGQRGQIFHLLAKAERAFQQGMQGDDVNPDHFIDMINYAVFALRLQGKPNGAWNWPA